MYPEEIAAEIVLAMVRTALVILIMFLALRLGYRRKTLYLLLGIFFVLAFLVDFAYQPISDFFYVLFGFNKS